MKSEDSTEKSCTNYDKGWRILRETIEARTSVTITWDVEQEDSDEGNYYIVFSFHHS